MTYAPIFEMWRIREEGTPHDIVLDLGHVEHYPVSEYPWFFGVRIPMADSLENGLATETEARRLDVVENRIREVIRARDGMYVGRRTGADSRDLLFYFESSPGQGLEHRIRSSIGMELLFISRRDAEWKGYEQLLPSQRDLRQIEDGKLIMGLLNLDADPDAVHEIIHRVEVPIRKGAEALLKLFAKLDLEDVEISGEKGAFLVTGIQRAVLDVEVITRVAYVLQEKSPKARGVYADWIAEPVFREPGDGDDDEIPPEMLETLLALGVEE